MLGVGNAARHLEGLTGGSQQIEYATYDERGGLDFRQDMEHGMGVQFLE